ncbi:MAG: hypothetical protein H7256_14715 [Bdellovibrio sp.]|nr:hypothetical protein [Bdellovibrio sp.]
MQIAIEDNGKGIDNETQEKLFQLFFTTKTIGQGTGLGLSVSHGIIKDHGGLLQLDTTSTNIRFLFTLPKMPTSF